MLAIKKPVVSGGMDCIRILRMRMKTGERVLIMVAVVMTGLYRITSGRRGSQLAPYAYQAECASYN